jgi:serine/threonine protein kinase
MMTRYNVALPKPTSDEPHVAMKNQRLAVGDVLQGTLAEYRVLSEVGRGGVGTVLKIERLPDGALFAAKLLGSNRFTASSDLLRRFDREMGLQRRIVHKNVIATVDQATIAGIPVPIMELAPNGSLHSQQERLRRSARFGGEVYREQCIDWMVDIVSGVAALHAAGIVHRDLTPKNVLLKNGDVAAVADFGIARMNSDETMTAAGDIMGSLIYISSKQREAPHEATFEDDIFSLGQLCFFLFTGLVPHGNVRRVVDHAPECPAAIGDLIERMRSFEASARPRDAEVVLEELLPLASRWGPIERFDFGETRDWNGQMLRVDGLVPKHGALPPIPVNDDIECLRCSGRVVGGGFTGWITFAMPKERLPLDTVSFRLHLLPVRFRREWVAFASKERLHEWIGTELAIWGPFSLTEPWSRRLRGLVKRDPSSWLE